MSRIFISYKRVDKDKVFKIKDQIESALGEKCWIDVDGIESDAQFANVIINAINNCEVFLFMYSKTHAQITNFEKDWTIRELNFATKKAKRIVFVNIDGSPLSDAFEFMYGTKQQVEGQSKESLLKLQGDLATWLSINRGGDRSLNARKISIVGVGGGGCNAINHMYCKGVTNINFYVCGTNFSALCDSPVPQRVELGKTGLGCSYRPEKGFESALDSIDDIRNIFSDDSEIVIVVTCLGGGTGTGATPLIAQTAKRLGKFVICVATIPFRFEGSKKTEQAIGGVQALKDATDSLILIPLEKIRKMRADMTIKNAFDVADQAIKNITETIIISITSKGLIDLNQSDLIDSFKNGGLVNCVFGESDGLERISTLFTRLDESPLNLHDDYERAYVVIKYPHKHPLTIDEYQYLSNPSTWGDYKDVMKLGVYEDFSEDSKLSMHFYQINGNTERTLKTLI